MWYSDSDTNVLKRNQLLLILTFLNLLIYFVDSVPSCPAEEIFLCRLLQSDSVGTNGSEERLVCIKEALALRHSSTMELIKLIEDTIKTLMAKIESIDQSLQENSSAEGQY